MKKLFLAVALLATSMVASAQFAAGNGGGSMSSSSASGHNSFYVQYNSFGTGEYGEALADAAEEMEELLENMDSKDEVLARTRLNGFTVGYNHAFGITPSVPLFVEFGVGLTYAWASYQEYTRVYYDGSGCEDEYSVTEKSISQHLMVNVPINLMYKFQLPNSSVTLEPYVGLNLRGHVLGRGKIKYTYESCCSDMEDAIEDEIGDIDEDDLTRDYFDKKDMGGKKNVASRFNIGWQIGANVDFGKYFVGISYGSDFGKFMEIGSDDWTFSATNITVGFRF